jgi:MFS family permease
LVYVPSHVLSGLYYDEKRSLATGLATSGSGVGAIIYPLLVNFLVDTFGWRGSFYIVCGISMQNIVFASLLRPVPERLKRRYQEAAKKRELECNDTEDDVGNEHKMKDGRQQKLQSSNVELLPTTSVAENDEGDNEKVENTKVHVSEDDIDLTMQKSNELASIDEKQDLRKETESRMESETKQESEETESRPVEGRAPSSQDISTKLINEESVENEDNLIKYKDLRRDSLNEIEKLALTKKSTCSILCDYAFIIFFANNIFWNMGVVIILLFGPQYLLYVGLDEQSSALVFSIGGIGAFVGSIIGGLLGNVRNLRLDVAYIVITVITGLVCLVIPFPGFHSFGGMVFLYVAFSVMSNMIAGLLVVAVAAIVGADAIGTGMGYIMLANGIGSIAAPPIIGKL